jgi:hypothetical protein
MRLRELWRLRLSMAASLLIALLAAVWSVEKVSLSPLAITPRNLEIASASTRVLVDTPKSLVLDLNVQTNDIEGITNRALLVSNVMASAPVRAYIERRSGVPAGSLDVVSPVTKDWPRPLAQSGIERRTTDILNSPDEYRLSLRSNPTVPLIEIYAQAPTERAAVQLADGAVSGMQDYLDELGTEQAIAEDAQIRLQQLGGAEGGVINGDVSIKVALLSFLATFAVCSMLVLFVARVGVGWRAGSVEADGATPA